MHPCVQSISIGINQSEEITELNMNVIVPLADDNRIETI